MERGLPLIFKYPLTLKPQSVALIFSLTTSPAAGKIQTVPNMPVSLCACTPEKARHLSFFRFTICPFLPFRVYNRYSPFTVTAYLYTPVPCYLSPALSSVCRDRTMQTLPWPGAASPSPTSRAPVSLKDGVSFGASGLWLHFWSCCCLRFE